MTNERELTTQERAERLQQEIEMQIRQCLREDKDYFGPRFSVSRMTLIIGSVQVIDHFVGTMETYLVTDQGITLHFSRFLDFAPTREALIAWAASK